MQNDNDYNLFNSVDADTLKKRLMETKKKVSNDRNNKKKYRILIISIIICAILLVASIFIFSYYKKLKRYDFDIVENENMYQYFSGMKVKYDGKVKIEKSDKGAKILNRKDVENIDDVPLYFSDNDNKVFFAKSMSIVIPRIKNKNYRINYFTTIGYEDNVLYMIDKYNKKIYLEDSFLYDGNDLYFFMNDIKITIDKKEYDLSALSYIIVNYKAQIEIYDKKNDKYIIIDSHNDDVIASLNNYKINLSTDMLMYSSDSRLLLKNINSLPLYEK